MAWGPALIDFIYLFKIKKWFHGLDGIIHVFCPFMWKHKVINSFLLLLLLYRSEYHVGSSSSSSQLRRIQPINSSQAIYLPKMLQLGRFNGDKSSHPGKEGWFLIIPRLPHKKILSETFKWVICWHTVHWYYI